MSKPNILAIIRRAGDYKDGKQVYAIRGIGEDYMRFYREWYANKKPVYTYVDFPWDYNTFTDEDEKDLIENWGDFIDEY